MNNSLKWCDLTSTVHYKFVGNVPVDDEIPERLPQAKLTNTGESYGLVSKKEKKSQKITCYTYHWMERNLQLRLKFAAYQ